MRKIETKSDAEGKRRRNRIIVGIVLVVVMITSTLGFALQSFGGQDSTIQTDNSENTNPYSINYNGYNFILHQSGLWILDIGGTQFAFMNLPTSVEGIDAQLKTINDYTNKPLYISSESLEAEQEIYRNLDRFVLRRQYACLEGAECQDDDFPVKTCDENFIIIKEDTLSSIIQENNCVYILGPKEDLQKLTDEFLYKIIGVEP